MNVLLISECSKRALTESRRILDQFAERRGERTWQTAVTWEGLLTLRKLLKKTARKNTAVSCHWIRGQDYSELLWIVGNAKRFNAQGTVPTNITSRDILRAQDENTWHTLEALALCAGIAGLFHDFGKANALFQKKLKPGARTRTSEPVRHEWVSLRLFLAFVDSLSDQEWLEKLHQAEPDMESDLLNKLEKDVGRSPKNPFAKLTNCPIALTVAWLVVSHHRLPVFPGADETSSPLLSDIDTWLTYDFNAGWNSPQIYDKDWKASHWEQVWTFPSGTPFRSHTWCKKAKSLSKKALQAHNLKNHCGLDDLFTSHLARLVLMLADHIYSSNEPTPLWQDKRYKAYANTNRETHALKQKLDEHNVGVGHHAYLLAKRLPDIQQQLPTLTRLNTLKRRTTDERFRWQDKAWDMAKSLAYRSKQHGFFGVNLASTGCGKTFANARIMYGLSDENRGCRFNVALGLRTLTLQTGEALTEKLKLATEDIAVLVGSQAVKNLQQYDKQRLNATEQNMANSWEQAGSESAESLFEEALHVHYEGTLDDSYLAQWLKKTPKLHRLVSAPILISTIDYLMPATDGVRGGKQIAPMLRLLTSDLVLDEPDDFDLNDLPALCRLVHWAGLLGSRVLLSSATLPPSIVTALYAAYQSGRINFNQSQGIHTHATEIPCAWFDEFSVSMQPAAHQSAFTQGHMEFVKRRIQYLGKNQKKSLPLRHAQLLTTNCSDKAPSVIVKELAQTLQDALLKTHAHHWRPSGGNVTGKKVSFGLIRMANINPLVAISQELLALPMPNNHHLHFCVYHGQYPLLIRSRIENALDRMLNRNDQNAIWQQPEVCTRLKNSNQDHHIFIVLGTSVTEVGRDHDYDWAIAEPSSMRSLIQLAGRIQRHRRQPPGAPNLLILNKNIRALSHKKPAYCRPGFESTRFPMETHDLRQALQPEQYEYINAAPRLLPRKNMHPAQNLADLEHAHMKARLLGGSGSPEYAAQWWEHNACWSAEFQRRMPFRQSTMEETFVLYQDDDYEDLKFYSWVDYDTLNNHNHRFTRTTPAFAGRISPWIDTSPQTLIHELAESLDEAPARICKRFMQIRLRADQTWLYHPLLGIYRDLKN